MLNTISAKIDFFIRYRLFFYPRLLILVLSGKKIKQNKILFIPEIPHRRSIMYKMCKRLGLIIVKNLSSNFHQTFFWEDSTVTKNCSGIKPSTPTINKECKDISKVKVDMVFEQVFGYGLTIDPRTLTGSCVIKSNENAMHDGRIIQCPISDLEPDCVYQKIIDNSEDESFVKDIRVPVIGNTIPLIYFKYKTYAERFTNEISHVQVKNTESVLTESEISFIIEFCKRMGVDYCELDVLRNKEDEKIYIVDVNKTPWGPPAGISKEDSKMVIEKMSSALLKEFCTV